MRYNSSTSTDLTDEELIQLVQDRNEAAFAQLAARHSFQIWQLVVLNSRQTRDAEEIFQDIWIAVWENIGSLREVSSFGAWLRKIAYTTCKRYYTAKSHTNGEILQSTEELAETIDQDAPARFREIELREAVTEAVHHLPEKVRPVAVLYYLELWTIKEIAEELRLAVGTVKTRLRQIRALLRKEFNVEEVKSERIMAHKRNTSTPSRDEIKEGFGMELTFERDALLFSLQVLQSVAGRQNDLPIPSNVLIRAEGDTIDLEVGIKMKVEGTVKEGGTITVPAKKLVDIVKELPADKPIDLVATAKDCVELTCGDGVYKIIGMPDEEFPQLSSVEGEVLSIGGETLRDVIQKTEYAASTEDVRTFLNGLYFNCFEDRTEIVATDGKRLALAYCEPLNLQRGARGFIVPLKAIREIPNTFADAIEVDISVFENQILFTDGNATLTTRLVDREYPNYQKIIPETSTGKTVVSKDQILSVARRMAPLSNPKNYAICLDIDTEQVRVSAKTPKLGEVHETLPVASGIGSIQIGFDARLLIDALAHIEAESVSIEFTRELNPVIIKPMGDDRHISLVMPLLLESPSV